MEHADVREAHEQGAFTPSNDETHGYTGARYWFRFTLNNPTERPVRRVLELSNPILDDVGVYIDSPDGVTTSYLTGDDLPFASRPVNHRNYIFPITVPAKETLAVYVGVKSESSMQVPMQLWTEARLADEDHGRQMAVGLYFGVMLIMVVYNVFVFLSVRDRTYLYYVLYVFAFIWLQGLLMGLSFQYLFPHTPALNRSLALVIGILEVCFALYTMSFLHLKERMPGWYRFYQGVIVLVTVSVASLPWCRRTGWCSSSWRWA